MCGDTVNSSRPTFNERRKAKYSYSNTQRSTIVNSETDRTDSSPWQVKIQTYRKQLNAGNCELSKLKKICHLFESIVSKIEQLIVLKGSWSSWSIAAAYGVETSHSLWAAKYHETVSVSPVLVYLIVNISQTQPNLFTNFERDVLASIT